MVKIFRKGEGLLNERFLEQILTLWVIMRKRPVSVPFLCLACTQRNHLEVGKPLKRYLIFFLKKRKYLPCHIIARSKEILHKKDSFIEVCLGIG